MKLFRKYVEVLRSYGGIATDIKKQTLYDEVADEFDIHWETAARIIRKKLYGDECSGID